MTVGYDEVIVGDFDGDGFLNDLFIWNHDNGALGGPVDERVPADLPVQGHLQHRLRRDVGRRLDDDGKLDDSLLWDTDSGLWVAQSWAATQADVPPQRALDRRLRRRDQWRLEPRRTARRLRGHQLRQRQRGRSHVVELHVLLPRQRSSTPRRSTSGSPQTSTTTDGTTSCCCSIATPRSGRSSPIATTSHRHSPGPERGHEDTTRSSTALGADFPHGEVSDVRTRRAPTPSPAVRRSSGGTQMTSAPWLRRVRHFRCSSCR